MNSERPKMQRTNGVPARPCALLLLAAAALAGCATGPEYHGPPAVDLGHRPEALAAAATPTISLDRWWEQLGDPALARLVDLALARNLDLRLAVLRIDEARAALSAADARRLPQVDASSSVTALRQSENGIMPVRLLGERDVVVHEVGVAASWEPDLFGRIRRGTEAATAQAEAAQDDADGVRLAVAAETARVYLSLRAAQRELTAREASIAAIAQVLQVTQQRVDAGDLPAAELDAVRVRLEAARAGVPAIAGRIRTATLALGTLTGGLPEQELALESKTPPAVHWPQLPVGQRADLLERRPDIRAAERRLAASTADVGLAQAERFPKLKIGASGGFESLHLATLLQSSSAALSLAPLITWRIFDGGRVQAQIHASEARQRAAAVGYERAVLSALSEVEGSLEEYRRARQSLDAQRSVTTRAGQVLATALARYARGDVSRLDVLDAEQQRSASQEAEAQISAGVGSAMTAALKALGGVWQPASGAAAAEPLPVQSSAR